MSRMFKRSIVPEPVPEPLFTFTPSLKELGFQCCSDPDTHEQTDLGSSIHIFDLSKLNIFNGPAASFKRNHAGYLTHIDGEPIIRRADHSKKGDNYVNHIS